MKLAFPSMLMLLTAAAVMPGCVYLAPDPGYTGPAPRPPELVKAFSYQPEERTYETKIIRETKHYTIKRIAFDSQINVVPPHRITAHYYDLPGGEATSAVIVLPVLGGENPLAKMFAEHFARNGYAAVIVNRQEQFKKVEELDELNRTFRQIILDHKQVLDWMKTQSDIDRSRIGVFGISAGGIKASLIHSLEDRTAAAVLVLVGGNLPYLLAYSTQKRIAKKRAKILSRHGITPDELYETLGEQFEHDPLRHAKYANAHKMLLVLAAFDQVVPFKKGLELRKAFGCPPTIVIPAGHYNSALFIPYLQGKAAAFFGKHLRAPTFAGATGRPSPSAQEPDSSN